MALTPRGKCISEWLPNEVIFQIIEAVQPHDQPALCRTCKLFHALGVPILYRVVHLDKWTSIVVAELVRSLTVTVDYTGNTRHLETRLSECSKRLLRIEELYIDSQYIWRTQSQLLSFTFPDLVHCTFSSYVKSPDPIITSFLTRHPALKSVRIPRSTGIEHWSSPSARIPLPNLQRVLGPCNFLPFITASGLKAVHLQWYDTDPEQTFILLKGMTRNDVPFVCVNVCGNDQFMPIMDSVSRHIPHTRTLFFKVPGVLRPDETQLKKYLSSFIDLAFWGIQPLVGCPTFMENEAEDQIMAQGLRESCPTLQACSFGKDAWRKVNGTWEKFPAKEFSILAGVWA
ncbi:hypothetical protein B0H13DRAFT_1954858 [Mycena leptocephala]|nr:hypothetical protein B0H13DRAFT_1954858 [Mycena leptocephala]